MFDSVSHIRESGISGERKSDLGIDLRQFPLSNSKENRRFQGIEQAELLGCLQPTTGSISTSNIINMHRFSHSSSLLMASLACAMRIPTTTTRPTILSACRSGLLERRHPTPTVHLGNRIAPFSSTCLQLARKKKGQKKDRRISTWHSRRNPPPPHYLPSSSSIIIANSNAAKQSLPQSFTSLPPLLRPPLSPKLSLQEKTDLNPPYLGQL